MENVVNFKKVNPISYTQKIKLLEEELNSDTYTEKEKRCIKREINGLKLERMSKNVRPYVFALKLAITFSIILFIVFGVFAAKNASKQKLKSEYEYYMQEAYEMVENDSKGSSYTEEEKILVVQNYLKRLNPEFAKFME